MGRRRDANRAEAIVRGIGGLVMLILLWGMVSGMPGSLRGKNPGDAIAGLLSSLTFFVVLFCAITVIGLAVWIIVLKSPRKPACKIDAHQAAAPSSVRTSSLSCADCGVPISNGIANYCQDHPHIFGRKSLCIPCQARYRRPV